MFEGSEQLRDDWAGGQQHPRRHQGTSLQRISFLIGKSTLCRSFDQVDCPTTSATQNVLLTRLPGTLPLGAHQCPASWSMFRALGNEHFQHHVRHSLPQDVQYALMSYALAARLMPQGRPLKSYRITSAATPPPTQLTPSCESAW